MMSRTVGAFDFPLRFLGQYFDRETNLAYNLPRDYDFSIGRYVESDPPGPASGMKRFFRRSLVLIVVLVAFQATAIAAEQSQLASCVPALPEGARQVIETKYSNWRILVDSDLNKDDQEIWSRTHRGECTGITSGRFVPASKADYAVLLVNKKSA